MASVIDRDKGLKALLKRMNIKGAVVTAGVHESEGGVGNYNSKTPATISEVASYNEFGTDRIPERSFLRSWFDESESENRRLIQVIFRNVLEGKINLRQGLDQMGLKFVGGIQAKISSGVAPPNAESTIRMKGSSTPLINTGQLRSSIRHKVETT